MFTFHNAPLPPLEFVGLELKPLALDAGVAKFDLTLLLEESSDGLNGTAEYNTDLFEPTTITQMLANFQALLERIAADPQQRLSTLTQDFPALGKSKAADAFAATGPSQQPENKEKAMQTESKQLKPGRVQRKAVRMEANEMVSIKPLLSDRPGPILLEALVEGVSLPEWARGHKG